MKHRAGNHFTTTTTAATHRYHPRWHLFIRYHLDLVTSSVQALLGARDLDEVRRIVVSRDSDPGGCQVLQRLQLRPILPQNKAMVFLWNAYLHVGLRGGEWEGQVRLIHAIAPFPLAVFGGAAPRYCANALHQCFTDCCTGILLRNHCFVTNEDLLRSKRFTAIYPLLLRDCSTVSPFGLMM